MLMDTGSAARSDEADRANHESEKVLLNQDFWSSLKRQAGRASWKF